MKVTEAVSALGALAQDSRLTVFRLLVQRGPQGYTPGELSEKTDIPPPTLSFHLRELQRSGLIEARREGRFIYYSAVFDRMKALIGFLAEKCCVDAEVECDEACKPLPAASKRGRVS